MAVPVAAPAARAGVRQVWLVDALRWCRRNQLPVSIPGLRRGAWVAAGLVLLGGGVLLTGLAWLAVLLVAALTGRPGDVLPLLPWFLLAAAARPVLPALLPTRRIAVARPADAAALSALELDRRAVWMARVLLPALAGGAVSTTVAVLIAFAPGSPAVPTPDANLVAWCLLPLPAAVLGSQLALLPTRSAGGRSGWAVPPALAFGLLLGTQLGRVHPVRPRWDDSAVLAVVGQAVAVGAAAVPAGWAVLVVATVGAVLTARPARRELARPWPQLNGRPATGRVRSVLATEVRRGTRLATVVHRRLATGLLLAAALLIGLAAVLPWPAAPEIAIPVWVGAAATVSLLLVVALVTSHGPLVHADTLRWLVDAGLKPRQVVRRHMRETLQLLLPPVVAVGLALAFLGRSWWLAPVTILVAVGTLLAACWADLSDPTREQQSDGSAESGVIAALLTALASGLLVATFAVLPVRIAIAVDGAAVLALAVLVGRLLLCEVAGRPASSDLTRGIGPRTKES